MIEEDPFKDDAPALNDNENQDTDDPLSKCKPVKIELSKVKCELSSVTKNGVKREAEASESDSEDETALSKRSRTAKSSKRKRSNSSSSGSDSGSRKSLRPRGKSKEVLYSCPFCTFKW